MDLTIIIPMYNSEKTINYCLKSIMDQCQKLFKYEVLIVDDGSLDNSVKIVEDLISDKDNFCLIKKENGGVSSARNMGLERAKGNYIWFIDSDDLIKNDAFFVINKHIKNNVDIFKFNYILEKIANKIFIKEKKIKNNVKYNLLNTYAFNSVCTQVVKRELIESNNIRFKEGYSYGEDYLFNLELYTKTDNVIIENEYIYVYKKTENSITRNHSIKALENKIKDCIYVYNYLHTYSKTLGIKKNEIENRINNEIVHLLKQVSKYKDLDNLLKNKDVKNNLIYFQKHKNTKLFYYKITFKTKIIKVIKVILKWFGF